MSGLCLDEFWNQSRFWDADQPSFTHCFTNVIFIIYNIVFILFAIPWIAVLYTHSTVKLRGWPPLLTAQLIILGLLMLATMVNVVSYGMTSDNSLALSVALYIRLGLDIASNVSLVVVTVLSHRKSKHISQSALINVYVLTGILVHIVPFYNITMDILHPSLDSGPSFNLWTSVMRYTFFIRYGLILLFMVTLLIPPKMKGGNVVGNMQTSTFISHCFLSWLTETMWLSRRRPLAEKHVGPTMPDVAVFPAYEQFRRLSNNTRSENSIVRIVFFCVWLKLVLICGLGVLGGLLNGTMPLFVNFFLNFVETYRTTPLWRGYFGLFLFFVAQIVRVVAQYRAEYYCSGVSLRLKAMLGVVIFAKASKLSSDSRKIHSLGKLMNVISVDVEKIAEAFQFFWGFSYSLGIVVVIGINMVTEIGIFTIISLGFIVASAVLIIILAGKLNKYVIEEMPIKDKRVQCSSEAIRYIKLLKYYAWEYIFSEKISEHRKQEILQLRKEFFVLVLQYLNVGFNTFVSAYATIAAYASAGGTLTTGRAFFIFNSLWIVNMVCVTLLRTVWPGVNAYISLKRLQSVYDSEEAEFNHNEDSLDGQNGEPHIIATSVSFSWTRGGINVLNDINLEAHTGKLVAVVGTVGSGKSALLCSLMSELYKTNGLVSISGRVTYLPQTAMIQSASVRDNILFGAAYDETRYEDVISACGLRPDIEEMPLRDLTDIGERGITLSGGQRQRVGLARAVYQDVDIYLLDDPLSAVDSAVDNHIFDGVIGSNGLLSQKCRLLVTHRLHHLPDVDYIYVLNQGRVTHNGTYKELMRLSDRGFINQIKDSLTITDHHDNKGDITHMGETVKSSVDESQGILHKLFEKEKFIEGSVSKVMYWKYIRAGNIYIWCLMLVFMIGSETISTFSSVQLGLFSQDPVLRTSANNTQEREDRLRHHLLTYGGFVAGTVLAKWVFYYLVVRAALISSVNIYRNMMVYLMNAKMSFFESTPTGRITNRISSDVDICDHTLVERWVQLTESSIITVCRLVYLCYSTPIFTIALLILLILFGICQLLYLGLTRSARRFESTTKSPIYSHFMEMYTGISVIRSLGCCDRFLITFQNLVNENVKHALLVKLAHIWYQIRTGILGSCLVTVIVMIGIINRSSVDVATFGVSIMFAISTAGMLDWTTTQYTEVEKCMVAVERLIDYTSDKNVPQESISGETPPNAWPQYGKLELDHVVARYQAGAPAVLNELYLAPTELSNSNTLPNEIHNASLYVDKVEQRGQCIGIVGRTGAGKSSLVAVILRTLELEAGKIILDDIDISSLALGKLREQVTVLPQEPIIFDGSVRFNLDPTQTKSDEELWTSLEAVHMAEFVREQGGLDWKMDVGDERVALSCGEQQLFCLARVLLRRSRLIILDEATASVDPATDELVMHNVREQLKYSTVLIIAHRISTLMDVDRMVVVHAGAIIQDDSPKRLLEDKNGLFYMFAQEAGVV